MKRMRTPLLVGSVVVLIAIVVVWSGDRHTASSPLPPTGAADADAQRPGRTVDAAADRGADARRPTARAPSATEVVVGAPSGGVSGRPQEEADDALTAEAQAIADDPNTDAICSLSPAIDRAEGYLAVGDPRDFNGRLVRIVDGQAFLPLLADGPSEGWLTVPGYAPVAISWTPETDAGPGRCTLDEVALKPGGTTLTGIVRHAETGAPAPGAWVEGCGGLGRTDEDGHFYLEVLPMPCTVLAMRQDGRLRTRGPMVSVTPVEGADTVVDLSIPGFKKAGLGVGVAAVDTGIEVTAVFEGTAAFEAGLEVGDLIVAIDGVDTVDVSLAEFVELAGGPEGSTVALTVMRGEEGQQEVEFERRPV